jgi:hypothetical protein
LQCIGCAGKDRLAGIGQRDAIVVAAEQPLSEKILEIPDLLADRGGGDAEFLGRPDLAALAGGRLEGPEGV